MRVLLVEDEVDLGSVLVEYLTERGASVVWVQRGGEALKTVQTESFDVVLLDLFLPDMDGMELLKELRESAPLTEVVILTGHGTVRTAVSAVKMGAFDFLTKPCSLEEVFLALKRAEEYASLKRESLLMRREREDSLRGLVFESEAMKKVLDMVKKITCSDCNVLITGETGTGKEVVARLIHHMSDRRDKPFVVVNVPSIPKDLLEAEIFGYEKGAFTGANQSREGFWELAKGGVIFLDEISEIDIPLQAKLLRVIETKRFYRVGGRREIHSDVRVIAATNRDLRDMVKKGLFREDLYYRLNTVEIRIPPLRERREDILPLAHLFLKEFSVKYSKHVEGFTEEAKRKLLSYHYPGNVRELRNIVERAVLFAESNIIEEDDIYITTEEEWKSLRELEKKKIEEALIACGYNKKKAAELLGIPLRTFYRKLERYGLI
ncbi:two component, sigma54 specific, transcriptional regulator, Fis family [Thermocrinis albus DSM 14484]|uniref:Two component, sigma54 specific, transcriptional regulator, Fis family n=1 Tax=Thermocrinis albus (strain DSM 14484 / JCM 11386 / HI 11/12) TaxID=638303 RepID=D3SPP7_THEAH|nr:sigma-54 dependent transcriptional regulator [Thermocrinis albus]ADC89134.1 two component, sigma54 specific, transcriptional regulator, Fis family [Thermocrinis albus DSM 14484]